MVLIEWTCLAGSVDPQTLTSYVTVPASKTATISAPASQTIVTIAAKLLETTGTPTDGTSGIHFGITEVV
jgi:hypothetical protein